jgi:hypothetical protein
MMDFLKKFTFFCCLVSLGQSCKSDSSTQAKSTAVPVIKNPRDLQAWILNETLKDYDRSEFGYDLKYIRQRKTPILLYDQQFKSMVLVSPDFQGRVLTSTADGLRGQSFGWMNYDLIGSAEFQNHMNAYGGEDRLWLGPEGGQFSLYFKPKSAFTYDNWQVPGGLDWEPFDVVSATAEEVSLFKHLNLTNYANNKLNIVISRQIKLVSPAAFLYSFGMIADPGLKAVGFESLNIIRNHGTTEWNRETGMPSIWILGMFKPSPDVTVVLPYVAGDEKTKGPILNDDYFGKVPGDRLVIHPKVIFFKADGRLRSKIGLNTFRARDLAGSYDEQRKVLTVIKYSVPFEPTDYVNSAWKIQDNPFAGDVVNAYNDGPLENGTQLGPFFELESSSRAANLKPEETLEHRHATYHFIGDEKRLDEIAQKIFGVSLDEIKAAFN